MEQSALEQEGQGSKCNVPFIIAAPKQKFPEDCNNDITFSNA